MAVEFTVWDVTFADQMRGVNDTYRRYIPQQEGESLDDQIFPWSVDGIKQDMEQPLPIHKGDPQTLQNIIRMMAVEMQHWADYHAQATWTSDQELKSLLGQLARAEHLHHLRLMSLIPTPHAAVEAVLNTEMSLLGAYAMCMENEPNGAIRNAFSHIFMDHLQHAEFAADQVQKAGCPVNTITGGADLSGGRPLDQQFMKPEDTIWQGAFNGSYDKNTVDPQTPINVDMALAGELAAWDGYMCAMKFEQDMNNKTQFGAFQSIEDQHVSILGSIRDPSEGIVERGLVHEQVEIQNYQRLMDEENNPQAKKVFADLYREDLEQARLLGRLMRA